MEQILADFTRSFDASFRPPIPYRGRGGTHWLISKVWSDYMKKWLDEKYLATRYLVKFEHPLSGRRRLDAAVWPRDGTDNQQQRRMDIALEWEWDNNKVANDFPCGDFRKLFEVDALCGLAIVQTRSDGKRGSTQADETVSNLQRLCNKYRNDSRSVGLIEIRRIIHQAERVEFCCCARDLVAATTATPACWAYP